MTLCQFRIDNAREDTISTRSSEKVLDYLNNNEEAEISKVTAAFIKSHIENYDMFLANLNKKTLHLKNSPHSRLQKKKNQF